MLKSELFLHIYGLYNIWITASDQVVQFFPVANNNHIPPKVNIV